MVIVNSIDPVIAETTTYTNPYIGIAVVLTICLQFLKFYLNILVGKQFYPNAYSYDNQMRKIGDNGVDTIANLSKEDKRFRIAERTIDGGIMYPKYIYFLIPYWNELPKTKKGKVAGYLVAIITVVQIILIAYLYFSVKSQ